MNKPIKKLTDFPQFVISAVDIKEAEIQFRGFFKDIKGVSERRSWLVNGQEYYIGDLNNLDVNKKTATFVNWDEASKMVKKGAEFYWIDGYWNRDLIWRILDEDKPWIKEKFKAQNAQVFIQNGVRGWCKVGYKIPAGAVLGEIIPDGWDHEHCSICWTKIGKSGQEDCYRDEDRYYLCVSCFEKYASQHNLAFTDDI